MKNESVISQIKGKIVKLIIKIILLSPIKNSIYGCILVYELIQFLTLLIYYTNPDLIHTAFFDFVAVFDILYFITSFNQSLIPLIILVIILVLVISQIIVSFFTLQNQKLKLIKIYNKIFTYELILLNRIGILPILHISSLVFICNDFSSELYSDNCKAQANLYKSIAIVTYVVVGLITLFSSYYINDDTMRCNLPWSQPFSSVEPIKVIQKLILFFIIFLGQSSKIVICVIICLLGILILYYRFSKNIFLNNKIFNGFNLVNESCIILASIFSLLFGISNNKYYTHTIILFILITISSTLIIQYISIIIRDYIFSNTNTMNINYCIEYFREESERILLIEKNNDKLSISILIAKIMNHYRKCDSIKCICSQIIETFQNSNQESTSISQEIITSLKDFCISQITRQIKQRNKPIKLITLVSQLEILFFKNYAKSAHEIDIAIEMGNDLPAMISIELHKLLIEKELKNNRSSFHSRSSETLDVGKISKFELKYTKLSNDMKDSALKCFIFWEKLLSPHINVNEIVKLSIQISSKYFDITKNIKKLLEIYPFHVGLLKTYSSFLNCVLGNTFESREYLYKAQQASKKNLILSSNNYEENNFGIYSNSLSIIISGSNSSLGLIINARSNIQHFLGYNSNDLENQNISLILPPYFSLRHNSYLKNYFETGKAKFLNNEVLVFAKTKENFIVPGQAIVRTITSLKNGLRFIGFIKFIKNVDSIFKIPQEYSTKKILLILADKENYLLGFTKRASKELGLVNSLIFNDRIGKKSEEFTLTSLSEDFQNPQKRNDMIQHGIHVMIDCSEIIKFITKNNERDESLDYSKYLTRIELFVIAKEYFLSNDTLYLYGLIIINKKSLSDFSENEGILNDKKELKKTKDLHSNEDNVLAGNVQSDNENKLNIELMSVTNTTSSSSQGNSFVRSFNEFKKAITELKMPRSLKYLNRMVIILLILLIVLGIISMALKLNILNNISELLNLLQLSFNRRGRIARLGMNIQTLISLSSGEEIESINEANDRFPQTANLIKSDLEILQLYGQQMNSFSIIDYSVLSSLNLSVVNINEKQKTDYYNLTYEEAITSFQSKIFRLVYLSKKELNTSFYYVHVGAPSDENQILSQTDKDIYFVLENSRNAIAKGNEEMTDIFQNVGSSILNNCKLYVLILTLASIAFASICVIATVPFIVKINKNMRIVLSIYSSVPIKIAFNTENKISEYLNEIAPESKEKIQQFKDRNDKNKFEANLLNVEENPIAISTTNDENSSLVTDYNYNNKYKSLGHKEELENIKGNLKMITYLIACIFIFIIYYIAMYFASINDLSNIQDSIDEIEPLICRGDFIFLIIYVVKYMIVNGNVDASCFPLLEGYLLKFDLLFLESLHFSQHPSIAFRDMVDYLKFYNEESFCNICCNDLKTTEECSQFRNHYLLNGLENFLSFARNNVVQLYSEYLYLQRTTNETEPLKLLYKNLDFMYNQISALNYIDPSFDQISLEIKTRMDTFLTSLKTREIIICIIFSLLILFILLFLWKIFINKLMRDITQSRGILNLLPADYISENQGTRTEIFKVINF